MGELKTLPPAVTVLLLFSPVYTASNVMVMHMLHVNGAFVFQEAMTLVEESAYPFVSENGETYACVTNL